MSMQKVKVKGQGHKGHDPFSCFWTVTPVWIHMYGDEMMHKAWCCLEEVPYCSSRSFDQGHPSNFKVTRLKNHWFWPKLGVSRQNRTVTPVWIHHWLWNDAQSLKQHRRGALLFFKVMRQFSRSRRTKKIANFYPTWAFPGCNSSLTSPMDLKWCTKLDVV